MENLSDIKIPNKIFDTCHFSKLKKTSALLLLTMLTACGGGSGGGDDETNDDLTILPIPDLTGSFKYLGYIDLIDDTLENRVNIDANFFEFVDVQDASDFGSSVPLIEDSCSTRVLDTIPTNPGTISFPELPFTLLSTAGGGSAGETVVLTSSAGTYATYALTDNRFDIATSPPLPDSLTLDLMLNTFPDFSSVTVPEIPEITNFQPQDITEGTVFTWTPVDANPGSIYMDFVSFAVPTVNGSLSSKYVEVYCRMQNDGEFALPQVVENILVEGLGNGFILRDAKRAKRASDIVVNGDAAFVITRISERF